MSSHDASASLLGYLFQCRLALLLALEIKNPATQLFIEKFDDVAFVDDGSPLELVQAKHHTTPGNLSEMATDLWKTIKVWLDFVGSDPIKAKSTKFVLITCDCATEKSAMTFLRGIPENRNPSEALNQLLDAAKKSENTSTKEAREAFVEMDATLRLLIVQNIWLIDKFPQIAAVRDEIEAVLRFSSSPEKIGVFVDHLEGWWFNKIITSLTTQDEKQIAVSAIQSKIYELQTNFTVQSLPLDEDIDSSPQPELIVDDNRAFVKQLVAIGIGRNVMRSAMHDHYRSSAQRSQWARQNMLLDGEMEKYDRKLEDAWRRKFSMNADQCDGAQESEKVQLGQSLLHWSAEHFQPLRNRDEKWISSGTFHILADELRVGWHTDFKKLFVAPKA